MYLPSAKREKHEKQPKNRTPLSPHLRDFPRFRGTHPGYDSVIPHSIFPNPNITKNHRYGYARAPLLSIMNAVLSVISDGRAIAVKVDDLSRSGMRVHANSRIARGTSVQVKCEELIAEGVVWQSRKFKGAYSLWIEFLRISRIPRKSILSKHHAHIGNAEEIYTVSEHRTPPC
jgi:hypothetical protein